MIEIDHNGPQVQRWLTELERKQIPFATAVALTRTARDVVEEEMKQLPQRFTIRKKSMIRRAIKSIRAEKRDWPMPSATVYVPEAFKFLADHEGGATRKGMAGHRVAVPTRLVKRTASGRVRKAQKPGAIRRRKTGYVDEEQQQIRQRTTKKRRVGIFYLLRNKVQIQDRWGFAKIAESVADANYAEHFQRELAAALGSKKRKAKISSGGGRRAYLRARQKQGALPSSIRQGADFNYTKPGS